MLLLAALAACQSRSVATPTPVQQAQPQSLQTADPVERGVALAPGEAARVGLLVPLSGSNARLGEDLLNAAQLALFDLRRERMVLVVRDTEGTAVGAREAAGSAVEEGAALLLGPLFASSVEAARAPARAGGRALVAFSNDRKVASPGAYVLGISPLDQVRRVVGYSAAQGAPRIAAILPRSAYGEALRQALDQSIGRGGAQLATVIDYDPARGPTQQALDRLEPGTLDAILIAEGGRQAQGLARLLLDRGLGPPSVRLLGTSLWSDPALAAEPALAGAWFAGPDPAAWQRFSEHYRRTYGSAPPRVASVAYDSVALAAGLLPQGGAGGTVYTGSEMRRESGFNGIDGLFRLREDGSTERSLAVLAFEGGRIVVRDPAPRSFEELLY